MNTTASILICRSAAAALFLAASIALPMAGANKANGLLDDFSDPTRAPSGIERIVIDDGSGGGQSHVNQRYEAGRLVATGEIVPGRGQPGWVSIVFLLNPDGTPRDLSQYEGVRMRIRVSKGMISVSANSTEVDNFDYHSLPVPVRQTPGDDVQEVRLPFRNMKRGWSLQTPLDPATITSISLTAVQLQRAPFAYEIDEIGFY